MRTGSERPKLYPDLPVEMSSIGMWERHLVHGKRIPRVEVSLSTVINLCGAINKYVERNGA